ncbi:cyclic GMP-AMP synthase-like receptor isoform X1 [Vanessa atalanta]|uniref:cyclic GMP-AMP synthase-like receptor isoform X1 n=2 Tax=Vanessa atalanta TaxID=42275 RepID=UPI001FCD110E|nr:cyclic GMP-AMP synthase-like receptor isoform X1 [Vanessa atalanta]XP_047527369.1 cyclic GMP-AMP synthase-like receptor isoform X1 [Vanessa atalanta]
MSAKKKNLDVYLGEVFKQFIALKENDLRKSQEVFKSVFELFKQKMGEQCNYFKKYASQVMYAGSVYDGIKVSKLDEFDMDIVIRLPVNYVDVGENGIIIENDEPGFVKLKIIKAFDNLDKQKEWDTCHKVTRDWRDTDKYLLQNKFRQWLHKIVQRTVNDLNDKVTVLGVTYLLSYKTTGPAYTLNIRNSEGDEEFLLDVDLVPVIRFMLPRWPEGYRTVENTQIKEWLVVPKPNKSVQDEGLKNRLWRLSFQDYERDMIKGCQGLKTTIRLVKKLRDELGMKAIASYYIKTLFLWKVEATDKQYWQRKISVIYREMVEDLYNAITEKNIPYFWNKDNNLIQGVKPTVLQVYANKLKEVLVSIDSNDVEKTVYFLLNTEEKEEFKNSEFYKNQAVGDTGNNIVRQASVCNVTDDTQSLKLVEKKEKDNELLNLVRKLMTKIDRLTLKMEEQEMRLIRLENERLVNNTDCVHAKDTITEVKPLSVDLTKGSVNDISQDSQEAVVSDLLIL